LRKKTPAEIEKAKVAKAARTLIRLKHSLAADEEINAVLPDTLDEFEAALAKGELKKLTARLDDVIGG
jgi:arginine/lysine/ornithine decarboxylase